MPKKVSQMSLNEQPIHWFRAFICGVGGATLMSAFIDCFYMLGLTPFSFELYLGSLLRGSPYGPHNFTLGLFANWLLGGLFGFVYAYAFEYVYRRATSRVGVMLGLGHAVLAAIGFFPFFNLLHEQTETGLFTSFGFFGSALGGPTLILLLTGHFLFGAMMGTFYGPVRAARVRAHEYEPGEMGFPGDPDVITDEEDSIDRMAV